MVAVELGHVKGRSPDPAPSLKVERVRARWNLDSFAVRRIGVETTAREQGRDPLAKQWSLVHTALVPGSRTATTASATPADCAAAHGSEAERHAKTRRLT